LVSGLANALSERFGIDVQVSAGPEIPETWLSDWEARIANFEQEPDSPATRGHDFPPDWLADWKQRARDAELAESGRIKLREVTAGDEKESPPIKEPVETLDPNVPISEVRTRQGKFLKQGNRLFSKDGEFISEIKEE
jgi:hypothetical protein